MKPPIFICGFPKSGTTLISQLFSNIPDVYIDNELHFASFLLNSAKLAINSGEVRTDKQDILSGRLRELAADNFTLYHEYVKDFFQNLHTGHHKNARWGNNCKGLIFHVDILKRLFPDAIVIFMMRDPRDVWSSVKHSQWPGQEQFSDFAYFKRRFREMYHQSLMASVHTLLYSDLVENPQHAFDLIDETFVPDYLAGVGRVFRLRTLPARHNEYFDDKIITTRNQRYKNELSDAEILEIEQAFPEVFEKYDFS